MTDKIIVTKSKNGIITLKPVKGEKITWEDIYNGEDLFWNDLYVYPSYLDGWTYLVDTNQRKLYSIDDYHYNYFKELMEGRTIKLRPMSKSDSKDLLKDFYGE